MSNKEVMNQMETKNIVHGYKVFNPDWTCDPIGAEPKQYTCPGKFEEEGELRICGHGMHFCLKAIDCFRYYSFNQKNKVAEVIAYGNVITEGNKDCTDKLEIVRELTWEEVLRLVNIGENCTGLGNTGNENAGDCNTGNDNSGSYNTGNNNKGHSNTGNCNVGDDNTGNNNKGYSNTGSCNVGDYNTGSRNTGSFNSGDNNTGRKNTGDRNTGDLNIGNSNIGCCNVGDGNSGSRNVGNGNIGSWNVGNWNKSSFNMGCFNTEKQKIILFNKPSNMTYCEWTESRACQLLDQIAHATIWVPAFNMTDEEKAAYPTYKTTGGYLKTLHNPSYRQRWWNRLSNTNKDIIKNIPNFDADIFFECTGIRVD